MPVTGHATPMPEADDENAWIVTITAGGSLYFGTSQVTPAGLMEQMKIHPRIRSQKLYIKADARAPYASVEKALAAARVDLFEGAVLLTSQASTEPGSSGPASTEPGSPVSPQGLEVLFVPPAGAHPVDVQVTHSTEQPPILQINNRRIPLANLVNMLTMIFQNRPERAVVLKADGQLPFGDVASLIDECHSTGATVIVPTPQL
jgi:biopolymer transport protein ExbD